VTAPDPIPAGEVSNVVVIEPKPTERTLVSDNGITRRYILGIGRKRIACDVTARVIDLTPTLKPGTLIRFEKPEQAGSEPKKSA
jgi:hypothetical protein